MGNVDLQDMLQVSQNVVPVDCPPGLEYLALIDQLIIKQKVCTWYLVST